MLNFIPTPITAPGPLTLNRGLEEPLVSEDLSQAGYKMWKDEFNGLDLAHAGIALEAYGKLHALGLALFEKKVVEDENIVKLLDVDMMKWYTDSIMDQVEAGMRSFREWMLNNDYQKEAVAKLDNELNDRNYKKNAQKLFEEGKEHDLQIIHHGDARSNNILFKYADNNTTPVEVKVIDYQFCSFSHPFFDLVYFLALSVPADILIPNYESLLQRY